MTVATVRIDRERAYGVRLDEGFGFITDIDAWPSFWPGLVRIEPGSRWNAPGDQACLVMRLLGREVVLELTLREFVHSRFVAYDSVQSGLPDAQHERHFRPAENGFHYRVLVEYETRPGLSGLIDRTLVRRGAGRAVGQTLANLERLFGRREDGGAARYRSGARPSIRE